MKTFDGNILRFNQICIISLIILALVLQTPSLIAFVALVMLLGTLEPRAAMFKRLYASLIQPRLNISPKLEQDDPRPHNFAQGLGAVFLIVSSLAFLFGAPVLAWGIAVLVAALAFLNVSTGICVGCFLYFQWRLLPHRFGKA